jgi:hypothetical protein
MGRFIGKAFKWLGLVILTVILAVGLIVLFFYLRPNKSDVSQELNIETWPAVADGRHNSNTDMIYWNDAFWMIHASAPWHFGSVKTKLVLWKSPDARTWEKTAEFQNPGEDIRDPKFAVIGDKLFMYSLKNKNFPEAEPYFTLVTSSTDGVAWGPMVSVNQDGWLFWRPKSPDGGKTWYVAAYWHEHGKSILLKSTDGWVWEKVSDIYDGDFNDETDIEFLPDGRLLATARLEVAGYYFGDNRGNTLIAVASPPYTEWTENHSTVTRLDGPYLFSYNGRVYAAGRYQPGKKPFMFETGSILSKRRTSLYLVQEDGLIRLSDLPSAGDTSYPGVVIRGDDAYISYYTSSITHDFPWIIGMLSRSDIMMAKVNLKELEALAIEKAGQ